ncbi:MAG: hypothetical protein KDC35_03520 [Acidobacteria bacterium]|nr:hypothetical protein [Acidobacteriota bacterium]
MSLKAFHYLFIALSIACAMMFGVWGLRNGEPVNVWMGVASLVAGVALIGYAVVFIRKMRSMEGRS